MLTGDDYTRIYKEVVLGLEPTDTSPEAMQARQQIEAEIQSADSTGGKFWHVPAEVSGTD